MAVVEEVEEAAAKMVEVAKTTVAVSSAVGLLEDRTDNCQIPGPSP